MRTDTRRFERLTEAERELSDRLRSDSTPGALRARALFELRWHDHHPAYLDRAIETLERARRLEPENPAFLNDLAVAYLELGEREQELVPMLRALDAVERALARDSALTAALFNRAVILERLYLVKSAERAWTRYLAVERRPGWRSEAEAHARRVAQVPDTLSWSPLLHSPPARVDAAARTWIAARVKRSPQAAREFGFPLLGTWGYAVERGDGTRATRLLALAREIGAVAAALGVDQSVSLAVSAIDSAAAEPGRLRALAEGHAELARGFDHYGRGTLPEASRSLERAEQLLRAARSPAALWAAFYRAATAVNSVDYESADTGFRRLLTEIGPEEPALAGKTLWALGLNELRQGNYGTATRQYRRAAPHIARAREAENEGAMALLLAESLTLAGQSEIGHAEAYRALRLLSPFRRSNFLNNHLAIVASYARQDTLPYAALAVTNEMIEVARALEKPNVLALALCARVRDLTALGRRDAARAEMAEMARWAGRISRDRGGERARAHVALALGQLTRSYDPRAALPLLEAAIETYSGFENELYLPVALYEGALAARATGDTARARQWLREAILHIEKRRVSFQTIQERTTFYETVESVFDAIIEVEFDGRRPTIAFDVLERARVAAWPPNERRTTTGRERKAAAGLTAVGARLPEDMLLVEYALLRDRLVVWTATRRGWSHHQVAVSRDSVAALVDRATPGTSASRADATDALERLHDLLLRPLARELEGVRQLTVVPDRELYQVPFAALRDRAARQYVVERYQVRTVPSAAFYLAASSTVLRERSRGTALVVGNPTLDTALTPRLDDLPGAALEADTVAEIYAGAELLRGAGARRGRVVELLREHPVFHFAGHAVFNSEQPELSYLALAPDAPGEDGLLRAKEIGELRLSMLQVVVLSACSTLGPRATRTGAAAGLAYSFLRAGAPATVSTLWDVDDRAPRELVVAFHRRLSVGTPAAEALRLAQVEALRSPRPELHDPQTWAAFVYTGP